MSARALSSSITFESSNVPYTRRILGYAAATGAPLSELRTSTEYSYSGYAFSRAYSASPPMYPVVPVLRLKVRCCSRFLEAVALTYMKIFGAMILFCGVNLRCRSTRTKETLLDLYGE
jgi:hypothetical protein